MESTEMQGLLRGNRFSCLFSLISVFTGGLDDSGAVTH